MNARAFCRAGLIAAAGVLLGSPLAGQISIDREVFDSQVLRPTGQPVIPVYEGWYENPDGSFSLCFGYFNLNTDEALDIPPGPGNNLYPAEYDGVQPTHFDPVPDPQLTSKYRHHWCVFTAEVPSDFEGDLVWTLATRGDTLAAPGRLSPLYILEEPASVGRRSTAPGLAFGPDQAVARGRTGVWGPPLTVPVGGPLEIVARVDPTPADLPTWLGWAKHRGPGEVTFSHPELMIEGPGSVATTARFSEPGEYVLRVQAINNPESPRNPSGSFEFHCCWTNGYVEVQVTP
ncbi:MAG: hypothetical protein WD766_01750 [Gemmatimonadota bacterium]